MPTEPTPTASRQPETPASHSSEPWERFQVGYQPRGARAPLDAASASVLRDELRDGPHSPQHLRSRAWSYGRDALRLRRMGDLSDADQYVAIQAALDESASELERR